MHAAVVGDTSAGKSCFVAALLRAMRGIWPKRPQGVAITEPGQGQTWMAEAAAWPHSAPELVRLRTAEAAMNLIRRMAGGDVAVETTTELHRWLREGWLSAYQEERERLNLRVPESMPVNGWVAVNDSLEALRAEADRQDVHLIQIFRRGPHYVALDDGSGVAETEHGLRSRGPSEGGRGGDLILRMDGGMPSRHRRAGDRVAEVIKDVSGLAVGVEISLPEFRGRSERQELVRRIRQALGPSLIRCAEIRRAEIEAWRLVKDEGADWQAARKLAHQSEADRLVEVVRSMINEAGLGGQTNTEKTARAYRLQKAFGEGFVSVATLKDLPLETLQQGVKKLAPLLVVDELQVAAQTGGEDTGGPGKEVKPAKKPKGKGPQTKGKTT